MMTTSDISLKDMKPSEIIAKVKSGEIRSCEYKTMTEYIISMEEKE